MSRVFLLFGLDEKIEKKKERERKRKDLPYCYDDDEDEAFFYETYTTGNAQDSEKVR